MFSAFMLIETADPAGTRIVSTVTAKYSMHLINQERSHMPVVLIAGLTIKPEEIADSKGVGP